MDFIKLYRDMEQMFDPFNMQERGELLTAMMKYCYHGEDTVFTGNERFAWPALRRHMDQCSERADTLRENGSKGGRPPKTKDKPLVSDNNQLVYDNNQDQSLVSENNLKIKENKIEENKIKENKVVKMSRTSRFTQPTLEEVTAYCQERGNTVDPQRFINHYSSNGWLVGKNPMKDWQAAVRTWERNEYTNGNVKTNQPRDYLTRNYTEADFENCYVNLDDADEHGRLPGEPGYGT